MVDIRSKIASLKANVVKRFFENQSDTLWKECFTQHLNYFGGKLLFQCDYDVKCLGTEIPAILPSCIGMLETILLKRNFRRNNTIFVILYRLEQQSHSNRKNIHILGRFL